MTSDHLQPGFSAAITLPRRVFLLAIGGAAVSVSAAAAPTYDLVSRSLKTSRQTTRYFECGPADGPLMIFLHGWPSIGLMWRAQMEAFSKDGWRCIAPDLRGYGSSFAPSELAQYTIRDVVLDVAELHDHLGARSAIWVGHDWGSVVASAVVAHEPDRSRALVLTSLAYQPQGHALSTIVPLVDRKIYPADEYPDGQWDYYRYYTTHFDAAVADLDADKKSSLASIFRSGSVEGVGKLSPNAVVTRNGGRFGAAHRAPPTKPDPALWPQADFDVLVESFEDHGFRPSCAWYMSDDANVAYAQEAANDGRLDQPVLFVNGEFDQICTITGNQQGDPMRGACPDLTIKSVASGHWLPLERKEELVHIIRNWLQTKGIGK